MTVQRRAKQLFDFLRGFSDMRHPAALALDSYRSAGPFVWWHDLPSSTYVRLGQFEDMGLSPLEEDRPESPGEQAIMREESFVLRVGRPAIPDAPKPPSSVETWVQGDWTDPRREVTYRKRRPGLEEGETLELSETDEAILVDWKSKRDSWAARHAADFVARDLFETFWQIHGLFERESERYELVLGDGHLSWQAGPLAISHPVLLQQLDLEFDPAIPEFVVREAQRPPQFYLSLFARLGNLVPESVLDPFKDPVGAGAHPLASGPTDDFLARLVQSLHPDGRMAIDARPDNRTLAEVPVIWRDPVVFVRSRAQGLVQALDATTVATEGGAEISPALAALCGMPIVTDGDQLVRGEGLEFGDEAPDVLLTKEANREQLEIARRLDRYGAVLVQGPPGTGKTHTIANLIGHLLSQGKSVLVTSHTTKALRVVREKVVPELRPLCVSILEGDSESNAQLQTAATTIAQRLSESDVSQLDREAAALKQERAAILQSITNARGRLVELASRETAPIAFNGRSYRPIDLAREVATDEQQDGWIPGRVRGEIPLNPGEVTSLYSTNGELSPEFAALIAAGLPDLSRLPSPDEFEQRAAEMQELLTAQSGATFRWRQNPPLRPDEIYRLAGLVERALNWRKSAPVWAVHVMHDCAPGSSSREAWVLLRADIDAASTAAEQRRVSARTHQPVDNSGISPEELGPILGEMAKHVASGRGFGGRFSGFTMNAKWKKVLSSCTVLGKPPATKEDFEALQTIPRVLHRWDAAERRWRATLGDLGLQAPSPDNPGFIDTLRDTLETLDAAIAFQPDTFTSLCQLAESMGGPLSRVTGIRVPVQVESQWPDIFKFLDGTLKPELKAAQARLRLQEISTWRDSIRAPLASVAAANNDDNPLALLRDALTRMDAAAYRRVYGTIMQLAGGVDTYHRREGLLRRLESGAPEWADAIRNRTGVHGDREAPSLRPQDAWLWCQKAQALSSLGDESAGRWIDEIRVQRQRLKEVSTQLIDRLAWAGQARRTTHEARMALEGYVQTIRRIGKGTGKNVPYLREQARKQMNQGRVAVPVWIAPLSRVAESFTASAGQFDAVIIDEASQQDVTGLLAWFLGRQVIVVGDEEQVTPTTVGVTSADMQQLQQTYLSGIPNAHLYDGQMSVYQLAKTSFQGTVLLREHFRCVPDIIGYSNKLSYRGEIRPLRDASDARVQPALVPVQVDPVFDADENLRSMNAEEARQIASLIVACTTMPEYDGLSFGVIPMIGDNRQGAAIERMLHAALSAEEIEKRRMLIGIAPYFQGDERDVIFLSMVHGRPSNGRPLRRMGDPGDMFKKRYNVAVSRARDQLWVVHTMDRFKDLQTDDLRRGLLDYVYENGAKKAEIDAAKTKSDSDFEDRVITFLVERGYPVIPQYRVGSYRIDLVVGDKERRLAVECDGDAYHSTMEQVRSDLERQANLERLGWTFYRIRGTSFYRNPAHEMEQLVQRLEQHGVKKIARTTDDATAAADSLVERVKSRAAAIRGEWARNGGNVAPVEVARIMSALAARSERSAPEVVTPPVEEATVANDDPGEIEEPSRDNVSTFSEWRLRETKEATPELEVEETAPDSRFESFLAFETSAPTGPDVRVPPPSGDSPLSRLFAAQPTTSEPVPVAEPAFEEPVEPLVLAVEPKPVAEVVAPVRPMAAVAAVPAGPGPILPFREYVKADLSGFELLEESPWKESPTRLQPMLRHLVEVEGPVHFETLCERVRLRYDRGRLKKPSRDNLRNCLARIAASDEVELERFDAEDNLFVAQPGAPVAPRRSLPDVTRPIGEIAASEIRAGLLAIGATSALPREQLIVATARAFGFGRVGAQVQAGLTAALNALMDAGYIRDSYGVLVVQVPMEG